MQIDPTRWLISVAGFSFDWIITREWKRVLLAMIPAFLFTGVAGLVLYGKNLNENQLASWYLEKGEEEVKDWENSWAGSSAEAEDIQDEAADSMNTGSPSNEESDPKANKISDYADLLFRRVQMLSPTDRAQFIIGVNLAQSGAISQGKEVLTKIAPDEGAGYAPAHAFLALIYGQESRFRRDPRLQELIKHHTAQAVRWDRVPQEVLLRGAAQFLQDANTAQKAKADQIAQRNTKDAIELLEQAAENDPGMNLELYKVTKNLVDRGMELYERTMQQAYRKAETHFQELLDANPKDDKARIGFAELYAANGDLSRAEGILQAGVAIERTPLIARGLSEIYRLRFRKTRISNPKQANIVMLDMAMRHDPTNPMVVQEIADIARVPGPQPNYEMINTLQKFLAEGKATALTHAWISEAYLSKQRYSEALPHLEQVVIKLPRAAQYLNNLAFVLSELHPERLEEALGYAKRAVAVSNQAKQPNADYFDTLGYVHSKLGQSQQAIAAFETAIELQPKRKDFHQNAADEYEKVGNEVMAENHRQVIERLKQGQE